MLRSLLIITRGGLVAFNKSWVAQDDEAQKELARVGALLRAVQECAVNCTSFPVSYVEYTTMALSFATHTENLLFCILIHELELGKELGTTITKCVLNSFVKEYEGEDFSKIYQQDCQAFNQKLTDTINKDVVKELVTIVKKTRGIIGTVFIRNEKVEVFDIPKNEIELGANIFELLESSSDLLQDDVSWIFLNMARHLLYIHRFGECSFVSVCAKNISSDVYIGVIEKAIHQLSVVIELKKLQGV